MVGRAGEAHKREAPVTRGWESLRLSFIVNRPRREPGFQLERAEAAGRRLRYTTRSYATARPDDERG